MPSSSVVFTFTNPDHPLLTESAALTASSIFRLPVSRTSCCSAGALSKAYDRGVEAVSARKPASGPAKYGT